MSDQWQVYSCQMGEHVAVIAYDHGAAASLDRLPAQVLGLRLAFRSQNAEGLPTEQEFDALTTVDEALEVFAESRGGAYVGRVSTGGVRHFRLYVEGAAAEVDTSVAALGQRVGYHFDSYLEADPERSGYWNDLYPSAADWRVIKDAQVIQALAERGDDGTQVRRVEHWAVFPTTAARQSFCAALGPAYEVMPADDALDSTEHIARWGHASAATLSAITAHTIALGALAQAHGGEYDGWETQLVTP